MSNDTLVARHLPIEVRGEGRVGWGGGGEGLVGVGGGRGAGVPAIHHPSPVLYHPSAVMNHPSSQATDNYEPQQIQCERPHQIKTGKAQLQMKTGSSGTPVRGGGKGGSSSGRRRVSGTPGGDGGWGVGVRAGGSSGTPGGGVGTPDALKKTLSKMIPHTVINKRV